jgi:ABC-2 type transport system permease protein
MILYLSLPPSSPSVWSVGSVISIECLALFSHAVKNKKVLNNKKVFVFYRDVLTNSMQNSIKFNVERRIEEVMVNQFTDFTIDEFRQIKQPLNMDFRNIDDPMSTKSKKEGWAGLFFGFIIVLFILLFGFAILRGTAKEKSNRISEVLVSIVKPRFLMMGKIMGIGITALIQLVVWCGFIGLGVWLLQMFVFPEFFISDEYISLQLNEGSDQLNSQLNNVHQNEIIELIYNRLNLMVILPLFFITFVLSYVFYGTFFSLIGAGLGSESDGQQFSIPLLFVLIFSLYSGYFTVIYPESDFSNLCQFIPFTSPVVVMVKLCQGYPEGGAYLLVLSLLILFISSILMLLLANRVYKRGILEFGHSLSTLKIFSWMKGD